MKITNKNLKSYLKAFILFLMMVALADVVLSQVQGTLGDTFKGYSAIGFPILICITYAYLGLPIFVFDAETDMVHIKSHLTFSRIFGKELYVSKSNIIHFEIDKSGIRKKLIVRYLVDGHEQDASFSISLLSKKKIAKLSKEIKLIEAESGSADPRADALFI